MKHTLKYYNDPEQSGRALRKAGIALLFAKTENWDARFKEVTEYLARTGEVVEKTT